MKYSKHAARLLTFMLLFASLAGCVLNANPGPAQTATPVPVPVSTAAPTAAAEPTTAPAGITVTDVTGRKITLDSPADRIVVLTASDCEILYALDVGNAVVGRGEYCDYPAEVLNVPSVQSGYETNIEQIIALKPQLVIMSIMAQKEEQLAALEKAGIKVFISDAQDIASVYTNIEQIGQLTGKSDQGAEIVRNMKTTFEGIAARAKGNENKTLYFEVSPLQYGLWTSGSGTFMNELAAMVGVKNAFSDVQGWGQISEEQVIERNPDYIVTIAMFFGEGPKPEDEIKARKGWENVSAVKNSAVFNLDTNELSRPGPRLAEGAQALYDILYGDGQ